MQFNRMLYSEHRVQKSVAPANSKANAPLSERVSDLTCCLLASASAIGTSRYWFRFRFWATCSDGRQVGRTARQEKERLCVEVGVGVGVRASAKASASESERPNGTCAESGESSALTSARKLAPAIAPVPVPKFSVGGTSDGIERSCVELMSAERLLLRAAHKV